MLFFLFIFFFFFLEERRKKVVPGLTLSKRLQSPMQEDDDYTRIRVCKEEEGGCLGVARQEVGEYLSSERGKHIHSSSF